ncbi:NrfG protein [Mannheimia granulomatis]|uniref:NrfG protein n=1 Tax=Mannheimia granulomatis TaxID=85402 RepID=A0A6G8JHY6_9PAST|nr:tetratricopeptide repeat protein [Mannheimia granulomatis]QIM66458.1 NrfG protein [Mannheimia granulomatis]
MSYKLIKVTFVSGLLLTLSACSTLNQPSHNLPERKAEQEKLYENTKNYSALISMYRDELKLNQDPLTQFKLSKSYYHLGDSASSLIYLEPLRFSAHPFNQDIELLYIRNKIQLGQYQDAYLAATDLIQLAPRNSEAYNLRGISLAQMGKLADAEIDINKARELFINDITAINNIAMLSILNTDYRNAVNLLLPQYLSGSKDPRLVHNLVFALVKSGDIDYALDIIRKENLNTSPEDLVNALKKTEKLPKVSMNK